MTDIALQFDETAVTLDADLIFDDIGQDIAKDNSLFTSVIISVFSDARVTKDELGSRALDDPDQRGWWGDLYTDLDSPDPIGSKAWLLFRGKATQQLALKVKDSIRESLQWMIDDDIASDVIVTTEYVSQPRGQLLINIQIFRKFGDPSLFDFVWDGTAVKLGVA